ncbi:hypothetical protein [Thermoleptolyngbya sp.]|jgi:hypothetical protein
MDTYRDLDQLTLTGAISLLTYLQYAQFQRRALEPGAIAATLCEMLSQLNQQYPGITSSYGWEESCPPGVQIAHSRVA